MSVGERALPKRAHWARALAAWLHRTRRGERALLGVGIFGMFPEISDYHLLSFLHDLRHPLPDLFLRLVDGLPAPPLCWWHCQRCQRLLVGHRGVEDIGQS